MYGGRIRAALSDSGPTNLATSVEGTAGWRRDLKRSEYGDKRDPTIREYLDGAAPVNNVDKIRTPLMIIQGGNDQRVPAGEAERLAAALKNKGIPVWYLLAKDEGHDWSRQSNLDFRLYAIALFVREQFLKQALLEGGGGRASRPLDHQRLRAAHSFPKRKAISAQALTTSRTMEKTSTDPLS
jgi:dipeptidyl aminopeptidase/acylaminoacyl peptidase